MSNEPLVSIIGPYLIHNFGDDLIGATFVKFLKSRYSLNIQVPYLSESNCQDLGIHYTTSAIKLLFESDALLIGGGGFLGDSGWYPSNEYLNRAVMAALIAKFRGIPVLVNGVGAGPLQLRSSRVLCKVLSHLSCHIGVRDPLSATFLEEELSIDTSHITAGADIALAWPDYLDVRGQRDQGKYGVQFDVLPYLAPQSELAENMIRSVVNFVSEHRDRVVLISNTMHSPSLLQWLNFEVEVLTYSNLSDFLGALSGLKAIFTSHLHLAIAAFAVGVPCFSAYVLDKTHRFYSQIGRLERAIDVRSATEHEVLNLLAMMVDCTWEEKDRETLSKLKLEVDMLLDLFRVCFSGLLCKPLK